CIVTTGLAKELSGPQVAHTFLHVWAGWVRMPLALGLLWLELWVLSHLFVHNSGSSWAPDWCANSNALQDYGQPEVTMITALSRPGQVLHGWPTNAHQSPMPREGRSWMRPRTARTLPRSGFSAGVNRSAGLN